MPGLFHLPCQLHDKCTFAAMWNLRLAWNYFLFRLTALKPEDVHSPYLFELFQFIHDPGRHYYDFDRIEQVRAQLLTLEITVPIQDFGAGSRFKTGRRVMDIARVALTPAQRCRVVYRLLQYQKPQKVLELGTSLGIMSAYLTAGAQQAQVHTIEGNPALAEIAESISAQLCLSNIRFHRGLFTDILPSLPDEISPVDFVLIDGDHRGEALKKYLAFLLPYLSSNAIVMIDDIRWSKDMFAAWKEITQDAHVRCAIDYFSFGLLFFRKDFLERVDLKVRLTG